MIYTLLSESFRLNDVLHGLRTGRGTYTAILLLKLEQELSSMDQEPQFLFFLDLHKAYDTVDYGCLMTTLEGYSTSPRMCILLEVFWDQQEVVTHKIRVSRPALQGNSGDQPGWNHLAHPVYFYFRQCG